MFATQNEQHQKEKEQLKDGFAKEMAQLEVNLWGIIHLKK
jgi:hypothetical protein